MVSFTGARVAQGILLPCVRWAVADPFSDRQGAARMPERGVAVAHAAITRGALRASPQLEAASHRRKRPVRLSWRMDETSITVRGHWRGPDRAGGKTGQAVAFLPPEERDERAAPRFLPTATRRHGRPETIALDGSDANAAAMRGYTNARGTAISRRQVQ